MKNFEPFPFVTSVLKKSYCTRSDFGNVLCQTVKLLMYFV